MHSQWRMLQEKQQDKIEKDRKKREEQNKKITPVGVALGGYKSGEKVTDAKGNKFIANEKGALIHESEYQPQKGGGSGGSGGSGGKGGKGGKDTAKQQLKEQERAQQESIQLRRKYEDTMLELVTDEASKEYVKIQNQYNRLKGE